MTLGHDLGVGYVVKGSVSSDAATVRVGAQLFNAQTGRVIWSETYDRAATPGALLGVRAELAASIATVLGQPYGVLNSDMAARLPTGVEPSMASYACVLRAYTYRRTFRDELAAAGPRLPRGGGRSATRTMPSPGRCSAGCTSMPPASAFVPDAEVPGELQQALDMASRAVAIDPQSVVALQALSAVQFHLGNFAEFERIQRQALALNPNDPDTLAQLGWRLAIRGRWDEGLPYIERAIARTINPPGWYYDLITIHLYLEGRLPRDARRGRALGGRGSHRGVAPRHRPRRARRPRGGAGGAGTHGGEVAGVQARSCRGLSRPPSDRGDHRPRSWPGCARPAGVRRPPPRSAEPGPRKRRV